MTKRELIEALESWTDVPDDALVLTWHDRSGDLYEAAPNRALLRREGDHYVRYGDAPRRKGIVIEAVEPGRPRKKPKSAPKCLKCGTTMHAYRTSGLDGWTCPKYGCGFEPGSPKP